MPRIRRSGAVWWGGVTYRRANVPGATTDTGFGLKFFE